MDRDRSTGAALIWTIRAPTSCPASCTARSRCRGYRRASESVSPGLDLRIDVGVQGLSGGGGPSEVLNGSPGEREPNIPICVDTGSPKLARAAIGRIFCAAATSADYALLSPCVHRYSYRAPQRHVCDESFACYLRWGRRGDMSRLSRSWKG